MDRQCPVKALALDAGSLRNFGDALGLGEVTQGNEQNSKFVFIFQCGFQILGGKIWVFALAAVKGMSLDQIGLEVQHAMTELD